MRCRILIALSLLLCVLPAAAKDDVPVIVKHGGEYTLVLPDAMRQALWRYNPHFVVRRQQEYLPAIIKAYPFTAQQAPFAVIGDLNGDGKPDVVLQGHDDKHDLLVGIISRRKGYRVVEILRDDLTDTKTAWYDTGTGREYGSWSYLLHIAPGAFHSPCEDRPLTLTTEAVQLEYYGRVSDIYYYFGGQFHEYTTRE